MIWHNAILACCFYWWWINLMLLAKIAKFSSHNLIVAIRSPPLPHDILLHVCSYYKGHLLLSQDSISCIKWHEMLSSFRVSNDLWIKNKGHSFIKGQIPKDQEFESWFSGQPKDVLNIVYRCGLAILCIACHLILYSGLFSSDLIFTDCCYPLVQFSWILSNFTVAIKWNMAHNSF